VLVDQQTWNQAVKDHENLVDLLECFGRVLSPLIFACASTNIYFICLTVRTKRNQINFPKLG